MQVEYNKPNKSATQRVHKCQCERNDDDERHSSLALWARKEERGDREGEGKGEGDLLIYCACALCVRWQCVTLIGSVIVIFS